MKIYTLIIKLLHVLNICAGAFLCGLLSFECAKKKGAKKSAFLSDKRLRKEAKEPVNYFLSFQ